MNATKTGNLKIIARTSFLLIGSIFVFFLNTNQLLASNQKTLALARQELSAGSYSKVLKLLRSYENISAYLLELQAVLFMETDQEVTSLLKKAIRTDGNNLELRLLRLNYLLRWRSNASDAIAETHQLLDTNPHNAEILATLGRALYLNGQTGAGLKTLATAFKAAPASLLCAMYFSDSCLESLNSSMALSTLAESSRLNPKSPEPILWCGKAHEQSGQLDLAQLDYSKAIALSPACPIAYYKRAALFALQQKYDKAFDDCTKAMAVDETQLISSKILGLRITCARHLHRLNDAVKDESILLKDVPKLKTIDGITESQLLAQATDLESLGKPEQALETISLLQRFKPNNTSALFEKANIYIRLGQNEKALTELNSLIARDAYVPDWFNRRAEVLKKLGRKEAADADLKKARELKARITE